MVCPHGSLGVVSVSCIGGAAPLVDQLHIPMATLWSLYALGTVEGSRVRRPRDPVAAWMLRKHPHLNPSLLQPSVLAMIRSRTQEVDRMIRDELYVAKRSGCPILYQRLGAGFDARWYRLFRGQDDAFISAHIEVDEPEVMRTKNEILSASTFQNTWSNVTTQSAHAADWSAIDGEGQPVVNLEGAATRLGLRKLVRVLGQIRRDCSRAHVILDLPGFLTRTGSGYLPPPTSAKRLRWEGLRRTGAGKVGTDHFRQLGWTIDEDVWLMSRPELRTQSGVTICPGVDGARVVRLVAC